MNKTMSDADAIVRQQMLDFDIVVKKISAFADTDTEGMESYRRGYLDALSLLRYKLNNQEDTQS